MRLDKLLARHGFGTRSTVKKLLRSGKVQVNGCVCTKADAAVDSEKDFISVDGQRVTIVSNVYIMINKPQNTLCASCDGAYPSVLSLLDEKYRRRFLGGKLHIAGRLDADTEGLLLCTSDGQLTHRIISPKQNIAKTYFVRLRDMPGDPELYVRAFEKGINVPPESGERGFVARSARLRWLNEAQAAAYGGTGEQNGLDATDADSDCPLASRVSTSDMVGDNTKADNTRTPFCMLSIFEGKYHQVKRMFSAMGNEVVFLKRIAIGSLQLDSTLKSGCWRELTEKEKQTLFLEAGITGAEN